MINLQPSLELELHKHWSASLTALFYWREDTRNGIYDKAGTLVRPDGNSSARYVGAQAKFLRNLEFEWAVSRFAPGRFIEETGRSNDAVFASAEIRFTF